jgi:hypothetical protein
MVNRGKRYNTKIEDNTTLNSKPRKVRQYKIEDNTTLNGKPRKDRKYKDRG